MKKGIHIIRRLMEPWDKPTERSLIDVICCHREMTRLNNAIQLCKSLGEYMPIDKHFIEKLIKWYSFAEALEWLKENIKYCKVKEE